MTSEQQTNDRPKLTRPTSIDSLFLVSCWRSAWLIATVCLLLFGYPTRVIKAESESNWIPAHALQSQLPWDHRQVQYEYLPEDRGFAQETHSPLDRFLKQAFHQSWVRFDYLNWNIQEQDSLLGAPVINVDDPTEGFIGLIRGSGLPPTDAIGNQQTTYVTDLSQLNQGNQNGFRFTYGLETIEGTWEGNVFLFIEDDNSFSPGPFLNNDNTMTVNPFGIAATSLLLNDTITNSVLTYDTSFAVDYRTRLLGTELNYIVDDDKGIEGTHFKYLFGFRYIRLDESMNQRGSNSQVGANDNTVTFFHNPLINSDSENNIFGPQIGAQLELVHKDLVIGARPILTFGFNRLDALVGTNELYASDDPTTTANEATPSTATKESNTHFAPVFNLSVYGKLKLLEHAHMFLAYDFFYIDGVARPAGNIYYNDDGSSTPAIVLTPVFTNVVIQGISIGAIIEF